MSKMKIRDLNLWYGDFQGLKNIDMDIYENQIIAFIGPSGSGKSTFIKTLNRMNDLVEGARVEGTVELEDRKSTRLNSSHVAISYAVFCLKKKKQKKDN